MCPPHDGTGYTCLPGSLPCKLMVLDTLRDLARGEQITLCTVGELKILSGRSCIFYKTILGQFRYLKNMRESSHIQISAKLGNDGMLEKLDLAVSALAVDEIGIYRILPATNDAFDVHISVTGEIRQCLAVKSPGPALDAAAVTHECQSNDQVVKITLPVYDLHDFNSMNDDWSSSQLPPLGSIVIQFNVGETTKLGASQSKTNQQVSSSREEGSALSSDLVYKDWGRLLGNYSFLSLTQGAKQLPSMATVAAEYATILREPYLAGFWKGMLPLGLLWYHCSKEAQSGELGDVGSMAYPSWSPFSNRGPVSFHCPRHFSYKNGGSPLSLAKVDDASIVSENAAVPFGPLAGWGVQVSAPMRRMDWRLVNIRFHVIAEGPLQNTQDCILADNGNLSDYFGPMAGLQAAASDSHPGRPDMVRAELPLPPLVDDHKGRALPQNRCGDPFWPSNPGMMTRGDPLIALRPQTEFWFLEIVHTHVPVGLVLVRVLDNYFKRVGMFHMGAEKGPQAIRAWDWEDGLRMRTCVII